MLTLASFLPLIELCNVLGTPPLELSLEDGFIANGGDSLRAAILAAACREHGLDLNRERILKSNSLRDMLQAVSALQKADQYRCSVIGGGVTVPQLRGLLSGANTGGLPTPSDSSDHSILGNSTNASPHNEPATLEGVSDALLSSRETIPGVPRDLLDTQLSFIHGTLRSPGSNVIVHTETYYSDDIPALKEAWRAVIESEPIFGQNIFGEYNRGVQPPRFSWVELQGHGTTQENGVFALSGHEPETSLGSFFTVLPSTYDREGRKVSKVTWSVHHALVDGYSAKLVFEKVHRLLNGSHSVPGPLFSKVARDLRQYQEENQAKGRLYWEQKRQILAEAQGSPSFRHKTIEGDHAGSGIINVDISSAYRNIDSATRKMGITRAALVNAAWALTLAFYCDSNTVVFGAVLSGRSLPVDGVLDVVGPLVNTLPLAVRLDEEQHLERFASDLYQELVELESVQFMAVPGDAPHCGFASALAVQFDLAPDEAWGIAPLSRETRQESSFPISIAVEADQVARFTYHRGEMAEEGVQLLGATFSAALELLQAGDNPTVGDALRKLQPQAALDCLEQNSNCSVATTKPAIKDDLVCLFERHARENPLLIAAEKGDTTMTYRDMDEASGLVASRLSKHISYGDVVAVHADRSIEWLVAIFGVLKAGGVYCPLDAGLPHKPRSTIFALSGAKCFLAPDECSLIAKPDACSVAFSVKKVLQERDAERASWQHRTTSRPEDSAYVCFTSGSTGVPKGVVCAHQGLVAFQSTLEVRLFAKPGRRVGQTMSVAFDGSIHELFSALTHGATLVLQSGSDPFAHLRTVDSAILTPSLARVLTPAEFEQLKWVYFVGEPVPQALSDSWSAQKQLYNMYGPTEGTCGATIQRLVPSRPVTIGVPNPTTRVYILTSRGQPAPPGMVGEIHLAGVQIAKGYMNLPKQTAERFLSDWVWKQDEKMYKTGDRGYWNENGEIVCVGRIDREVKARGFRLDLNDLEVRIANADPSLSAVAVDYRDGNVVAMVQPASVDVRQLRKRLALALPHYAVPQSIMPMDKFPMTPAGKVDYKKIAKSAETIAAVIPHNILSPSEKAVAEAFRSVLQLPGETDVKTTSNFIELGGHSLRQIQLLRYLRKHHGVQIPLQRIMEQPTVRGLGALIADTMSLPPQVPATLRVAPHLSGQVSPIEKEWVQKYQIGSGTSSFNVCYSSVIDNGSVDRRKLVNAWNLALERHGLLSCRYNMRDESDDVERRYCTSPPRVQCVFSIDLWTEANRPFNVAAEDPIRVFVTESRLVVVMSHIIADYTALKILLNDAAELYHQGKPLHPSLPRAYTESLVWSEEPPQRSLDFWADYLRGCPENPPLLGRTMERESYGGTSALSLLSNSILEDLVGLTQANNVTLQQVALACVAAVLDPSLDKTEMLLGAPYMNRETEEDLETFGLFLEPLPIRISHVDDAVPGSDYMQHVRASAQTALSHAIPWNRLLDHLAVQPQYPTHPLFDVMVTVHDFRRDSGSSLDMDAPGFETSFLWSEGAKFKLLVEFTVLPSGKILVRIEHDTNCVSEADVRRLQGNIPLALALLAKGVSHGQLKQELAEGGRGESVTMPGTTWTPLTADCVFGKNLSSI
ncbi:nonribosomal peptide synthase GliP-like [Apiospora arundinis]|uniref:Nonribosomal peptide synthase GliP-like n=1 Tax=Apiospora arundinis TaxID=335852 RepID=A0ABR2I379_9PEZI